jgi:uncharacterized protein YqkB
MIKTSAEQLKESAEKMEMGKVAGLMFLVSKNDHILEQEHTAYFQEYTIYYFTDKSTLILDSEEETIELNATKERIKEVKRIIKEYKNREKMDTFYSINRNWSDLELDLYL